MTKLNKNLKQKSKIKHGNHNHPAKIERIQMKIIGTSKTQGKLDINNMEKEANFHTPRSNLIYSHT